MTEIPEKLDLRSADIAAAQQEKLRQLFPEVFTEGGKVDFDRLKSTLGEIVDSGKERYGMNWPGKSECFRTIQAPSRATLRPMRSESENFDSTENVIIEGDNLEVLKLLQKGYLGQVKMIYIDPPYNTGNDFIYPDNYSENLDTYLAYTGQVDGEGRKYSTNTETDGRFHSKWLNMVYPRLFLARNLLREDGVIFISIDDHEVDNLRKVCAEVFGEENFVANIIWQKKYAVSSDAKGIPAMHDHILVYQKSELFKPNMLPRTEKQDAIYKNPDNDPRGLWRPDNLTRNEYRERDCYPITSPKTGEVFYPPKGASWRHPREEVERMIAENRIWFGLDGTSRPAPKRFLTEVRQGIVASAWWPFSEVGHNDESKKELMKLFDGESPFDTPKPTRLIERMLQITTSVGGGDLVLDFFGGSGTTGHGVFSTNLMDGGNRKFILVQLPEATERKDYRTIADITKERMRRAGRKIRQEWETKKSSCEDVQSKGGTAGGLFSESESFGASVPACATSSMPDTGFKVFKLDTSNFKPWDGTQPEEAEGVAKQLELHVDHVLSERSQEDILTELLLKSGFPLSTKIDAIQLAGKQVFSVEEGTMLVCLDGKLTPEVIKAMADMKPSRVICLDDGFQGNDQLKTNAVQTMKARGVLSFRTV